MQQEQRSACPGCLPQEMKLLNEREVQIVDTTCPWVSKVWNAVDNQSRKGHTSIIHGKWAHEETIATASFAGERRAGANSWLLRWPPRPADRVPRRGP